MAAPELSVIVPVWGRDIAPLVASIDTRWAEVIVVQYPYLWNISRAANMGIRRASGRIIAKVDADLVLPPAFIDGILEAGPRFCVCPVRRLGPGDPIEMAGDLPPWGDLSAEYWPCGGWQSAPREFWFDLRGYDEGMILYGAEDTDMMNRAKRSGVGVEVLDLPLAHSWHESKAHQFASFHAGNARLREARKGEVVRNRGGWGLPPPEWWREVWHWLTEGEEEGDGDEA